MAAFIASASFSHVNYAPEFRSRTPSRLFLPKKHVSASAVASDFCSPKSRLAAGDTLHGIYLLSYSPTQDEIAALAGYEHVIIDLELEHGKSGVWEALACLRALDATRTPPSSATRRLVPFGPRRPSTLAAASMGYLHDPENTKVQDKLTEAEMKVLQTSRAYLGGFAVPNDPTEQPHAEGVPHGERCKGHRTVPNRGTGARQAVQGS
uniref:Uncharacterized protein n=1 Tax=Avena sativa TaxID=4498 RepID=A0ACD5Z3C0_AVESA